MQRDWWWYCSDWTCERFSFCPHQGFNWGPLDLSSCTLPLCHLVISGFHLWQFQVLKSGAEGLVVVLFWLELVEIFFLPTPRFELCHSDLWWEIFFLPTPGFELGTSASLSTALYHCATVISGFHLWYIFRHLTVVQIEWWWYCSDWTCERIFFLPTPGFELAALWISSPALYHSDKVISGFHLWHFQAFNSGAERMVVVLFWLVLWEIFFLPTPGFELGTSGSLVLHSTTVPGKLLLFTSDNCRYLAKVQREWSWYCSDWTCERFSFYYTRVWTGDLWISNPALNHCARVTSAFHIC